MRQHAELQTTPDSCHCSVALRGGRDVRWHRLTQGFTRRASASVCCWAAVPAWNIQHGGALDAAVITYPYRWLSLPQGAPLLSSKSMTSAVIQCTGAGEKFSARTKPPPRIGAHTNLQ